MECVKASIDDKDTLAVGYRMVAFWTDPSRDIQHTYEHNVDGNTEMSITFDNFQEIELILEEYDVDREVWKAKYCRHDCRSAIRQWDGLWPISEIYAETNGLYTETIYVNKLCALCHSAANMTEWGAEIKCEQFINDDENMDIIVNFIQNQNAVELCKVRFTPSIKSSNHAVVNTFLENNTRCILHRLTSCRKGDLFNVPQNINLSRQDIIIGCEMKHSFSQKLYVNEIFSNILCEICNGIFNENETSKVVMLFEGETTIVPFTMYLNYHDLSLKGLNKRQTSTSAPEACDQDNTKDCRPILCPTMQGRNAVGQCQLLNSRTKLSDPLHDIYKYTLSIELSLTDVISFRNFFVSCKTDCQELLHFLNKTTPPEHYEWDIIYLGAEYKYYENAEYKFNRTSEPYLQTLVIFLGYTGDSTYLELILEDSRILAEGQWTLVLEDSLLYLKAGFFKPIEVALEQINDTEYFDHPRRKRFVETGAWLMEDERRLTPDELAKAVPSWVLNEANKPKGLEYQSQIILYTHYFLYLDHSNSDFDANFLTRMYIRSAWNHFTEMYYCDQIYLYEPEFDLIYSDSVLYYKSQKKYFYLGEFELYENSLSRNGADMARVCLSSTNFHSSSRLDSNILLNAALSSLVASVLETSLQKVLCSFSLVFLTVG